MKDGIFSIPPGIAPKKPDEVEYDAFIKIGGAANTAKRVAGVLPERSSIALSGVGRGGPAISAGQQSSGQWKVHPGN